MTKRNEVYVCEICGNMVEVVHAGGGSLVCCGQPMKLLEENVVDAAVEKHVPVVTRDGDKLRVQVGSVPHPMIPEHFIEWIELISPAGVVRESLKPGDAPEVEFCAVPDGDWIVRAYCNLHGLWKDQK